jgi:hypothetical protein
VAKASAVKAKVVLGVASKAGGAKPPAKKAATKPSAKKLWLRLKRLLQLKAPLQKA